MNVSYSSLSWTSSVAMKNKRGDVMWLILNCLFRAFLHGIVRSLMNTGRGLGQMLCFFHWKWKLFCSSSWIILQILEVHWVPTTNNELTVEGRCMSHPAFVVAAGRQWHTRRLAQCASYVLPAVACLPSLSPHSPPPHPLYYCHNWSEYEMEVSDDE